MLKNIHDITSSSFHHFVQQSVPRKMRREADVSFFSKETPNTKKYNRRKKKFRERNASSFVKKNYTHTTHLLRLIHYYISKRAQLTTAFLPLFLRDTLRCSHESAFLRRFIRSRYILLSVLILLLGRRAILEKIKRCRVTENY